MAGKRYIQFCGGVTIMNLDGTVAMKDGQPSRFTMKEFVDSRIVDAAFGTNNEFDAPSVYAGVRVTEAFKKMEIIGDWVELDEDDYQRLLRSTMNPKGGYNPVVAISCVPFIRAIEDAKREIPALKEN